MKLKKKKIKSDFLIRKDNSFFLPGEAFLKLFKAVIDKRAAIRFRARGFSMSPFIKDGDIVTVYQLLDVPLQRGDIVAFIHSETGKLIIHRVVGKKVNYYLIKGDNVLEPDGLIIKKHILGRVVKVERNGKDIFLGLGPERFLIALLSRKKFLFPLLFLGRRLVRQMRLVT